MNTVCPPDIDPNTWQRMSWHQRMVWLRNHRVRRYAKRYVERRPLTVKPGPLVCTTCGAVVGSSWAGFTDGQGNDYCARFHGPIMWVES